ncbi:rubrerythrin-like domain-containing protein [Haloparvum sp. PAK95]
MRPHTNVETSNEFECCDCGRRVEAPSSRRCSECEGQLVNVGTERDL